MNSYIVKPLLLASLVAVTMPVASYAQGSARPSYRITPPLRVAARPVDGLAPRGVTQADPFKPREAKEKTTRLAVQGYCLVSLRDQQQWVQGSPKIQVVLGGKIYLFSSERTRDIFLAAPHLYLPALDGDCLVTFAETGKRVTGQLEYGLVHAKRVYFFADQTTLSKFQEAPHEYVDADLVDGGACIVSKLTERKFVPGLPDTVAMVDGRRYFFASAYHRRIFEQSPVPFLVQPLRNLRAAARLEVPAFAEVLEIDSLSWGEPTGPLASDVVTPFNKIKPAPGKKKSPGSSGNEESDDHEDFLQSRAMAGYCPVTIRTQNIWRRGKVKFKYTFDGNVYFLAGSEELAAFQANPVFYAPVLGGDSVVSLATHYERVAGSVFHAFIYKDRLYLFVDEEERDIFRANPALFDHADLAAKGICLVSRVDDKQEIVGVTEFETLYRGKRYRFASRDYLEKFVANPKLYAEE
jgi:YHS domain-containing protein